MENEKFKKTLKKRIWNMKNENVKWKNVKLKIKNVK